MVTQELEQSLRVLSPDDQVTAIWLLITRIFIFYVLKIEIILQDLK